MNHEPSPSQIYQNIQSSLGRDWLSGQLNQFEQQLEETCLISGIEVNQAHFEWASVNGMTDHVFDGQTLEHAYTSNYPINSDNGGPIDQAIRFGVIQKHIAKFTPNIDINAICSSVDMDLVVLSYDSEGLPTVTIPYEFMKQVTNLGFDHLTPNPQTESTVTSTPTIISPVNTPIRPGAEIESNEGIIEKNGESEFLDTVRTAAEITTSCIILAGIMISFSVWYSISKERRNVNSQKLPTFVKRHKEKKTRTTVAHSSQDAEELEGIIITPDDILNDIETNGADTADFDLVERLRAKIKFKSMD